jgi:hypothetical protein
MVGDIESVLDGLNRARVRYLVVGGVAVVLHGHLRTTADLDLVLHLEHENLVRAMEALTDLGYRPRAPVPAEAFVDAGQRQTWIEEKDLTVFSLWNPDKPGLEVDLFVTEPFDFDRVYARALRVPLETTEATVISMEDLRAMKQGVGRPRDLEDLKALDALRAGEGPIAEGDHG